MHTARETYRLVALALLDAADAVESDDDVRAPAHALLDALSDQIEECDRDALLTIAVASVFLTSLANGVRARDTLESLFHACA